MEQKPKLNIMVDLETASTKENAAILSWAMMPFTTDGSECSHEPFYKTVNLTSCFMAGMDIEKSTQQWWQQQTPEARAAIMKSEGENILDVTRAAYCWLSALAETYDLCMYCRGIDFDLPKIEWCFRKFLEQDAPYKYSHKMDVRTILKFMEIDQSQFEFEGVKHQSLDDCVHDIKMIQKAYQLKNDWMTAYVAVDAKKTADEIKAKRAKEEAENEGWLALKELGEVFGHYYAIGSSVTLYREDVKKIDDTIYSLKASLEDAYRKNNELRQQIKDLQAKA